MSDTDKFSSTEQHTSCRALTVSISPECDIEKYREYVHMFDLTPDEETELLKSLWLMMAAFVDLGFGVDSIQLLSKSGHKQGAPPAPATDVKSET